jgi:hypothetical protein
VRGFCWIAAGGGPGGWARPPAGVPAEVRPTRPGRTREAPSVGASQPLRLSSYTARPPVAGGATNGHLPCSERCSPSIRLTTHGNAGSTRQLVRFARRE